MNLQHTIKAFIRSGETHYVAECVELAVVTQGVTLDETLANLREAVALHIEGEDLSTFGLVLDIGTLNAIMRQASRFIPEDELRREFYTD